MKEEIQTVLLDIGLVVGTLLTRGLIEGLASATFITGIFYFFISKGIWNWRIFIVILVITMLWEFFKFALPLLLKRKSL
jgi:hypothetical protein